MSQIGHRWMDCRNCEGVFAGFVQENLCPFCRSLFPRTFQMEEWPIPYTKECREVTTYLGTPCLDCRKVEKTVESQIKLCFDCMYPCLCCGSKCGIHDIRLQFCYLCCFPDICQGCQKRCPPRNKKHFRRFDKTKPSLEQIFKCFDNRCLSNGLCKKCRNQGKKSLW